MADDDNTIEFSGEPYFGKSGRNFNFIVASCISYSEAFGESSDHCEDPTTQEAGEIIAGVSIIHKFVVQYFNLDIF